MNNWRPLYAHDWHQCRRCGCTRPESALLHFGVHDSVLNLKHDAFECKERKVCEQLKKRIQEQAQREQGLDPKRPIHSRKAAR